jgi:hypothetical protein
MMGRRKDDVSAIAGEADVGSGAMVWERAKIIYEIQWPV